MNRQEIFDTVLTKLREQVYRSDSSGVGGCAYRGSNGRKCAVGHLIPDAIYSREMENKTVGALIRTFRDVLPDYINNNQEFLRELQMAHDEVLPNIYANDDELRRYTANWEERMQMAASLYGLKYTQPEA